MTCVFTSICSRDRLTFSIGWFWLKVGLHILKMSAVSIDVNSLVADLDATFLYSLRNVIIVGVCSCWRWLFSDVPSNPWFRRCISVLRILCYTFLGNGHIEHMLLKPIVLFLGDNRCLIKVEHFADSVALPGLHLVVHVWAKDRL